MLIEKFELPHYYKPERFMKPKFKSEKKKRKCMTCATEFISTWNGNRICKSCLDSSLWKSGANFCIQTLGTVGSTDIKKQPSTPEEFHDEKYLLDEEFDS
tara:strand:+ start:213 stop:512 length:300 start_codon:yes stop_codon:yes gene_type:complete